MKILVRKSDKVVFYADADLRLTEGEAVGTNWLDQHFNTGNADIYEAELPANFTGGVWSYIGGVWAVVDTGRLAQITNETLSQLKTAKNLQINEWRSQANRSTFPYAGKVIACDELSRSDIDAVAGSVAMNNAFPAGFPNAWKATDNSYISLPDIAAFKAMYNAMTLQGTLNFAHSQQLKTALASAQTAQEIDAIKWEA